MAGFATPNESPQHLEARLQLGSACKKGDLQAVLQLLDGGEIALDQERYDGCLCATADSAHPRSAGWPSNGAYSYQGYVDTARMLLDRRKVALARLLLEHGAGSDLYRKDRDGSTPLTPASGHPGGPDWAQRLSQNLKVLKMRLVKNLLHLESI